MTSEVVSLWRQPEAGSGRDAELSTLGRELDEARSQGRARFAFVRGPAGVGKTHLFRLFRAQSVSRGALVFEAGSPREVKRPFGLFGPLLSELLEHLAHAGVPAPQLAQLSRRVGPLTRSEVRSEAQRLELFDAATEVFVLAGRESPVFLFPDVDAADKSSLELFRYLAAVVSAPESRAGGLFVASFREDAPLPTPLAEVVTRVSARTLSLSGFDLEGIRAFLSRSEVAERLFEATGGMPDALEELLTRPAVRPVELFARRVERLSERTRAVLGVLSVSPQALSLALVVHGAERLGVAREDVAPQLDALVREHVVTVRVVEGEPRYRFLRDAQKEAFLAELPPSQAALLRRGLAEGFVASGELALASELLAEVAPSESAALAVRAAKALAGRGAHEEAVELFERALPHLEAEERALVHLELSVLAEGRAEHRRVVQHLSRARVRTGQNAPEALLERAARSLIQLGRLGFAQRLLERVRHAEDPTVRARAHVGTVEIAFLKGRTWEAIAQAEGALPLVEDHPEQVLALRNALGRGFITVGELARADAVFEQNHALAQSLGMEREAARALGNRGVIAQKRGDREAALRWYQAAAPSVDRTVAAKAMANLGGIYANEGEFELALDMMSRTLQAFSRLGSAREVALAASNLARVYAFLGDRARGLELSEYALERARELGEKYLEASALLNLGELALDGRDSAAASRLLGEARDLFAAVGHQGHAALATAEKARAHLASGERAQAQADLERPLLEKGFAEMPAAQIEAELVRGELSLILGDLHGAGRAVSRVREILLHQPDLEGPYRVYFLMGRIRLTAGDTSGAQAEMGRAARLLDQLTQRVPPQRRAAFLAVPRRAEVLGAVEPELRLPRLERVPQAAPSTYGLVGRAPALARITRQIEPIARANTTVLIRGESGTGKEVLAQAIHDLSPRRGMPLVKVNCAAMVEDLLLSELFGHEKGAFTGAIRERKGRFEMADGGTLFLDEIGDISPKAQVALLRVLQEREFERVGGTKTIKVDVRLVCATNRDLEALIAQGRFRQDLYYRLKGVMLELPPLRDRIVDLPLLAEHFLARCALERNETPKRLSGEALELLQRHPWPGNVRELENVLSSAVIFAEGQLITPECFSHIAELAMLAGEPAVGPRPPPVGTLPPSAAVEPIPRASAAAVPLAAGAGADEDDGDADEERSASGARVDDVDFYALARTRGMSLKDLRHQLEMQCIKRALEDARGNISEAARLLKMKRSRLSQIVNAEPELKGVCNG